MDDNIIEENVIIRDNVVMGKRNHMHPYVTIGQGPQHIAKPNSDGKIIIGDDNVFREYSSVNLPTGKTTKIGSNCYIMSYAHIAHDCTLGNNVILSARVMLGGHTVIDDYANLGLTVTVHPFSHIGCYAMVGLGQPVTKDVLPFSLIVKSKFARINRVGLERNGISNDDIESIHSMYGGGLANLDGDKWYEQKVIDFLKSSTRDYYPPAF